ncbi:hypothetical protein F4819DRAFT_508425 [Hypoxylon fuscum]|nr:hypothetical protein F4819DRAFT_508425 [Hypoxylon fuscum]
MAATSEIQIESNSSQCPPPPYVELDDNTNNQITPAIQIQSTPGPARNGKFYHDEPGLGAENHPSVKFWLQSEPGKDDYSQPWYGEIHVKCNDVPRLMRKGFHWTTANVIREEGFLEGIDPKLNLPDSCTITRNWFLRDLQQPPHWIACIKVHSPNAEVASGIRLDNWTTDMVHAAYAFSLSSKCIYQFHLARPQDAYNAIYDDTPLEGWWPWPKKG